MQYTAMTESKSKNLTYQNGVTLPIMKRIAQFWFQKNYVTGYADKEKWRFIIIVKEGTEDWTIKMFHQYWETEVLKEARIR